ncbi:MAG: ABC transporter ATP-binding protein [Nitrospirota bacterium]
MVYKQSSPNTLLISQLKMVLKKKVVLNRIELKVNKGEIFGITGINGSGKTVFIKVLATLLRPTEGKVWIDEYDIVKDRSQVRNMIGYMPDSTGFDKRLSVREYLEFFRSMYQRCKREYGLSYEELLNRIGLNQISERLLSNLSRGERQKVSLIRAVIHNPSLLLLDDPDAGMDPTGIDRLYSLLKELSSKGTTIIVSSHSIPFLSMVSRRIGIIHSGEFRWILQTGIESIETIKARIQKLDIGNNE